MNLNHVMIDLETLGTVPGCVILSVGAVAFDPAIGLRPEEFYSVVSTADAKEKFMSVDPDTVKWWSGQSEEARQVIQEAAHVDAPSIIKVCADLNNWLSNLGPSSSIRMYGNGADFDNPLLRVMYDCAKVKPYASPWGGRCYRTLKNLHELFGDNFMAPKLDRTGTYHNALDDAKTQAMHLVNTVAFIKSSTRPRPEGEYEEAFKAENGEEQ